MANYQWKIFTLIELMVVIAIVGMLLGISAPLYASFIIGDGVSRDAGALKQELVLCQSYSRHFQCYTAVFFPGHRVLGHAHPAGERCYRSAVLIRKNGKFVFSRWLNDSAWKFTEKSVYLDIKSGWQHVNLGIAEPRQRLVDRPIVGTDGVASVNRITIEQSLEAPLKGLVQKPDYSECKCMVFTPMGKPYVTGFKVPIIHLGLGYWENGSRHITNIDDFLDITIDRETGRVSYER